MVRMYVTVLVDWDRHFRGDGTWSGLRMATAARAPLAAHSAAPMSEAVWKPAENMAGWR